MKLVIREAAAKRLSDLPPKARAALLERLRVIAANPFAPHPNVRPLKGQKDAFRLRQGDWRAVYRLERSVGELRLEKIEPRGDVYR